MARYPNKSGVITMQRMKSGLLILLLRRWRWPETSGTSCCPAEHALSGDIIAESCRVEAGDRQMTVNMGQISSNRFHSAGKTPTRSLRYSPAGVQYRRQPARWRGVSRRRRW
jgi:fimbrial protein